MLILLNKVVIVELIGISYISFLFWKDFESITKFKADFLIFLYIVCSVFHSVIALQLFLIVLGFIYIVFCLLTICAANQNENFPLNAGK